MPEFPPLQHVALTVADRSVSVPWYQRLFDAEPVLDEDTGLFHHVVFKLGDTLFGVHTHPEAHRLRATGSTSTGSASTT